MSHSFTFRVDVELERDSGKFASRDEMADALNYAFEEAAENAELSSLGPEGDSQYIVVSVSSEELDKKASKALNAEYEAAVRGEVPSNKALLDNVKLLKAQLKKAESDVALHLRTIAALREEQEVGATRIYQGGGWQEDKVTYFADGPYDDVKFKVGGDSYDRFSVKIDGDALEIRSDFMGGEFAIRPLSGNMIRLERIAR